MIKRTLFFGNPAYLSTRHDQLVVHYPNTDKQEKTIPVEDVGYVVLEHPQITITNGLLMKLVQNKTAVITCDKQHLQPLVGHTEQTERIRHQLNASLPLKKNLWQQTIVAKIYNQAIHLEARGYKGLKLRNWSNAVKSGDTGNLEAIAAAYYFQNLFNRVEGFSRNQKGVAPNNLLNYGYAILRAIVARALVSSGMLPSVGIFHRNKYNAFCLADDIMEPYRIYVDAIVYDLVETGWDLRELSTKLKTELLKIPALNVYIDGKWSPLMNAVSRTTSSLYDCFQGINRRVLYPQYLMS